MTSQHTTAQHAPAQDLSAGLRPAREGDVGALVTLVQRAYRGEGRSEEHTV